QALLGTGAGGLRAYDSDGDDSCRYVLFLPVLSGREASWDANPAVNVGRGYVPYRSRVALAALEVAHGEGTVHLDRDPRFHIRSRLWILDLRQKPRRFVLDSRYVVCACDHRRWLSPP